MSDIDNSLYLRVLGLVVFAIGFALAYNPELISNKPIPESTYEAIERRIWWGAAIGLGILLLFHHQLRPWLLTLAAVGVALTLGILIARLIGIALDGSVAKQWFWVGVELVALAPLVFWYAKQSA